MYKIFCVLSGLYLQAWYKYISVDAEGIQQKFTWEQTNKFYYKKTGERYLIVTTAAKFNSLLGVEAGRYTHVFVKDDLVFDKLQDIQKFVTMWFTNDIFQGVYISGQVPNEVAEQYANGDEQYPRSSFEIHRFTNNKLVEYAALCDCIRFKQ